MHGDLRHRRDSFTGCHLTLTADRTVSIDYRVELLDVYVGNDTTFSGVITLTGTDSELDEVAGVVSCVEELSTMRRRHSRSLSFVLRSPTLLLLLVAARRQTDAAGARFLSASAGSSSTSADPCYDGQRTAQRCLPDFDNAAFSRHVTASSTCGLSTPSRHCWTTKDRDGRVGRTCYVCDNTQPRLRHPPAYLTDLNNPSNVTCWISESLEAGRYSDDVNVTLTLSLGKKFEVRAMSSSLSSRLTWYLVVTNNSLVIFL